MSQGAPIAIAAHFCVVGVMMMIMGGRPLVKGSDPLGVLAQSRAQINGRQAFLVMMIMGGAATRGKRKA